MKTKLAILSILAAVPLSAVSMERSFGWCQQGNQTVQTGASTSTTLVQRSYPSCSVTVYVHGGGLATIYSTSTGTPLANPFTADILGFWFFYAANGDYDVQLSGGDISGTVTLSDVLLADTLIPGATYNGTSLTPGNTGWDWKLTMPTITPTNWGNYAGQWIDYGGFPTGSLQGATTTNAGLNEVFRVSSVNSAYNIPISMYGGGTTGTLQVIPFYAQSSVFVNGIPNIWGGNVNANGCSGVQCNGVNFTDYDVDLITGFEADIEARTAGTNAIGVHSVCVNCTPFVSTRAAFVANSLTPHNSFPSHQPWGVAYDSAKGAALHGMILNPTSATAASDSQDMQTCAFIDAGVTTACSSIYTSQNQILFLQSPGTKVYLTNLAGNALASLHYQQQVTPYATTPNTVQNTAMSELAVNTGASGTVQNSLPATPVAGSFIRVCVTSAGNLFNWTAGSNTMQVGSTSGTILSSSTLGSCALIIATSTTAWYATDLNGVWLLDGNIVSNTANKFMSGSAGGATVASGAAAQFFSLSGNAAPSATEATREIVLPFACQITGLYLSMSTASGGSTGATTIVLRQNGGNSTLTFNLTPNQAAGFYSDTTQGHQVSASAGDVLSVALNNSTNNGATGNIISFAISYR